MTPGLKEFTKENTEMRGESITQYRIYDKHKVIWTIKREDLHLGEDLPGRGLGNQMTQQRRSFFP